MASISAAITRALPSQQDLKDNAEHCSADPARLATIGRACGQQVRIYRTPEDFALYTVSEVRPELPDEVVRMGRAGRQRLSLEIEFPGVVDSRSPRSRLSESRAKTEGDAPGFTIRDSAGETWFLAFDPKSNPEGASASGSALVRAGVGDCTSSGEAVAP